MIEIIRELTDFLGNSKLIFYQEDEYYYIMSENDKETFFLLQETSDQIIIWSYDTQKKDFEDVVNKIKKLIKKKIIFPYVSNKQEQNILLNCGFEISNFNDENIDEKEKQFPSFERDSEC